MRAGISMGGQIGGTAPSGTPRRSHVRALVRPGERPTQQQAEAQWAGWQSFFALAEGAGSQRKGRGA